jgi:hypothetical protein
MLTTLSITVLEGSSNDTINAGARPYFSDRLASLGT